MVLVRYSPPLYGGVRPVSLYLLRIIIAVSETRLNSDSKSVIEMGVAGRLADQRSKKTESISWHLPATPRSVVASLAFVFSASITTRFCRVKSTGKVRVAEPENRTERR